MLPVIRSNNWLPGIFNDFFGNEWLERRNTTAPAVNIIEDDERFRVEFAAPGMTKEDCRIEINDENHLLISMQKKTENSEKDKKGRYLRREFSYSAFRQSMILPENADLDRIDAAVENGVLHVDIPKKKAEELPSRTRTIEIK